jgi:hypothetical protein
VRSAVLGTVCQPVDEDGEECLVVALLLQQAQRGIRAFVAYRQGPRSRSQRDLWGFDASKTPRLQPAVECWLPKRVTVPVRQRSNGPLRDFFTYVRN